MSVAKAKADLLKARKEAEERGRLKAWAAVKAAPVIAAPSSSKPTKAPKAKPSKTEPVRGDFVSELRKVVKPGVLVEVVAVRRALAAKGWNGGEFEAEMHKAERAGIVDLKTGNDPRRIPEPDQAIKHTSSSGDVTHLQYVVLR